MCQCVSLQSVRVVESSVAVRTLVRCQTRVLPHVHCQIATQRKRFRADRADVILLSGVRQLMALEMADLSEGHAAFGAFVGLQSAVQQNV